MNWFYKKTMAIKGKLIFLKYILRWTAKGFPGGPVVKTFPASAGGAGSVPGWELKPHTPHSQKPETQNRRNIVTNSTKTLKNGPHFKKN